MYEKLVPRQSGFSAYQLLTGVFAVAFFLLAFYFRFNAHGVLPGEDRGFRILMLIYFAWFGYKMVPALTIWVSRQEFMAEALLSGSMSDLSCRSSSRMNDSMANLGEYWSSILAGYFFTIFTAVVYRLMRMQRTGKSNGS